MKPLGYFSERGGTTFAGVECRQTETIRARSEIEAGVDEYIEEVSECDCEEPCECKKAEKVLVRIR